MPITGDKLMCVDFEIFHYLLINVWQHQVTCVAFEHLYPRFSHICPGIQELVIPVRLFFSSFNLNLQFMIPHVMAFSVMNTISDTLDIIFSEELLRLPSIDFLYPLTDKISCVLPILQTHLIHFSPLPLKLNFPVMKPIKLSEIIYL